MRRRGLPLVTSAALIGIWIVGERFLLPDHHDPVLRGWWWLGNGVIAICLGAFLVSVRHRRGFRWMAGGRIVVVVPVHNEDPAVLREVIDALVRQTMVPDEIHVVDDGSAMPVVSWSHPRVRWHCQPERGKAPSASVCVADARSARLGLCRHGRLGLGAAPRRDGPRDAPDAPGSRCVHRDGAGTQPHRQPPDPRGRSQPGDLLCDDPGVRSLVGALETGGGRSLCGPGRVRQPRRLRHLGDLFGRPSPVHVRPAAREGRGRDRRLRGLGHADDPSGNVPTTAALGQRCLEELAVHAHQPLAASVAVPRPLHRPERVAAGLCRLGTCTRS